MAGLWESIEKAVVKLRRKRVSRRLFEAVGGVVQMGPFAGLRLDGEANLSAGPLAAKMFGLYEQVLLDELLLLGRFETVVNLGAADGYYPLGLLKAGFARRAVCFELEERGRAAIRRNAERNALSERVVVDGAAGEDMMEILARHGVSRGDSTLVLCDIEGAEFSVLTEGLLAALAGATHLIELHDRKMSEGLLLRDLLQKRFPPGYSCRLLKGAPARWSGIEPIEALSDNDRALVTSEGRRMLGEWLVATPPGKRSGSAAGRGPA